MTPREGAQRGAGAGGEGGGAGRRAWRRGGMEFGCGSGSAPHADRLKGTRPPQPTVPDPTELSLRARTAPAPSDWAPLAANGLLARLAPAPHRAPPPRRLPCLPFPRPRRGRWPRRAGGDGRRAVPGAGGGGLRRPLHAAVRGAGAQGGRTHQPQPYGGMRHRPRWPRRRRGIPPQSRPATRRGHTSHNLSIFAGCFNREF